MGSEIPEWAMEAARVALISHPGKYDPMLERVARALVAAERRGIERAAVKADAVSVAPDPDEMDPYDEYEMGGRSTARAIAAAIRQLGDTP
jgi:predicted metal-dependent phosphoesterase TrpH